MKITTHSKKRIRERVNSSLTNRNVNSLFKNALKNGYSPSNFQDCKFKQYLMSHSKKSAVKVFQGNLFFYNGSSKTLYTVWSVPEQYLNYEFYLKKHKVNPNVKRPSVNCKDFIQKFGYWLIANTIPVDPVSLDDSDTMEFIKEVSFEDTDLVEDVN